MAAWGRTFLPRLAGSFGRDLTLRYVLDGDAIEAYRRLGEDTVQAMSEAADSLSSETDEFEAAAELSSACLRRGMYAPVLLAASEERLVRHRHPVPHGGPWESRLCSSSAPSAAGCS